MVHLGAVIAATVALAGGQPVESQEQRDARMNWWREARFGMFIHWGLYSILEGEWNGNPNHGEWIMETAQIPVDAYEKLLGRFNPVKFDAKEWARIAKDAGMQYVVLTSKHHEGFALYDSKVSDYDVMATPFKRDILKELSEAVRGAGLTVGWYHSIMDWHHPAYVPARKWNPRQDPTRKNLDDFVPYLRAQVTEILSNYGPVGVVWFDGEWESTWNDIYGKPLYELCRQLQPNTIVNNRVSNNRQGSMESAGNDQRVGDFSTPEQHIPATGLPGVDWETCMTMNDHWGWNRANKNWKSSTQLIRNLVDIVSKGGNYLLNVGPLPDGTFPQESIDRLAEIGRWMKVNGEAIFGTNASVFGNLPWGRSTTKGSTLYLHVFDWPSNGQLVVPGLGSEVKSARVLGGSAAKVDRKGPDVHVLVGPKALNTHATVVALEVVGEPLVYNTPTIDAPTDLLLDAVDVTLTPAKGLDVRYTLGDPEAGDWKTASGPIRITSEGTIHAASFHGGKRVSGTVSKTFKKVYPQPAEKVSNLTPGLACEEFEGIFDSVADVAAAPVKRSFTAPAPAPAERGGAMIENIGRRYRGYVQVPEDGVYTIHLNSDDGSRLTIAGLTLDNDGLHSAVTKTLHVPLLKGWHKLELLWFNRSGGAALELGISKAGGKPQRLEFGF